MLVSDLLIFNILNQKHLMNIYLACYHEKPFVCEVSLINLIIKI